MNLQDQINQAEKTHQVSDYVKLHEGANYMRIMTFLEVYPQHFSPNKDGYKGLCLGKEEGCPGCKEGTKVNIQWLGWVAPYEPSIDDPSKYEYTELKLIQLPHTVAKGLSDLQNDPDYAFDTFPMPYNVKIIKKKTGEKQTDVEYNVLPGKESEVPLALVEELSKKKAPAEIKELGKQKKAKEYGITLESMKAEAASLEEVANTAPEYPTEDINPEDIPF